MKADLQFLEEVLIRQQVALQFSITKNSNKYEKTVRKWLYARGTTTKAQIFLMDLPHQKSKPLFFN
jgi:hypothetical protein